MGELKVLSGTLLSRGRRQVGIMNTSSADTHTISCARVLFPING